MNLKSLVIYIEVTEIKECMVAEIERCSSHIQFKNIKKGSCQEETRTSIYRSPPSWLNKKIFKKQFLNQVRILKGVVMSIPIMNIWKLLFQTQTCPASDRCYHIDLNKLKFTVLKHIRSNPQAPSPQKSKLATPVGHKNFQDFIRMTSVDTSSHISKIYQSIVASSIELLWGSSV